MAKHILVTGSTGYIASRLIPQLLEQGHHVRALARRPHLLRARGWFNQIEVVQGDVMDAASLAPALRDIHTAYYLIHNMSSGHGYTERELEGARNFARTAEQADVKHIIYLGGLADPEQHIAPHMRSRIATGAMLRAGNVPVTEFRAGVIAGSGSISFEMIRFMTELFPIIPGPRWLKHRSQPIATQNVIDYLLAALDNRDGHGQVFEIGGPQTASYQELMFKYAHISGHKRAFLLLPYVPVWFMAFGIGWMTPVPYPIAYALVRGLLDDSVVVHTRARAVFPEVKLIDFESAVRAALTRLHPLKIERVWDDDESAASVLKHEGFFIDHRAVHVDAAPERIFKVITGMGNKNGWLFANWLWQLRGWIDKLFRGQPLSFQERGRGEGEGVPPSGMIREDFYRIDSLEPDHLLLLHSRLKAPGEGWMEWRVIPQTGGTRLTQTAYFTPRGLPGFLYWYLLYPVHAYVFRGLIRAIARHAES